MSSGINKHFKNAAILMVAFFLGFGILASLAGLFEPKIMQYQVEKQCLQEGKVYSAEQDQCVSNKINIK